VVRRRRIMLGGLDVERADVLEEGLLEDRP
jgi:hypothetical protein